MPENQKQAALLGFNLALGSHSFSGSASGDSWRCIFPGQLIGLKLETLILLWSQFSGLSNTFEFLPAEIQNEQNIAFRVHFPLYWCKVSRSINDSNIIRDYSLFVCNCSVCRFSHVQAYNLFLTKLYIFCASPHLFRKNLTKHK